MLVTPTAFAQKGKAPAAAAGKAGDKKANDKKASPKEIELEDEAADGPVTAGQMTEEAAQAKRLFDAERWSEAALLLKRVVDGETGDDEGNKQIAQYHLAIALYRLQFYQASYAIFSEVADKTNHLKFNETLLWLSKLATQLPEPADIIERVGKYKGEQVARFNNPQQRDLFWQLNYLLGRYKYRNRNYDEAISLFEKVDTKSKYYVQAQFFTGISNVQLPSRCPR
jgi:tetratricopeptide (TPR) repeat protein